MPTGNLPEGAKKIYMAAEANAKKTTCKGREDPDACAAKIAWSAVKNKYKKVGDKWIPKAEVSNFSMAITRTSYDKATNTRRWKAIASDIDDDLYNDNMTLELYEDFMNRIESQEQPPEAYRSDFWSGGMPYLSVSHYLDLNGKGVPGPVDTVYIDGAELKSRGRFDDTPIGRACFQSISRDLDTKSAIPDEQKIRISIAFLDWKHKHKSNGFVFDRTESEEVMCPECLKEMLESAVKGKLPKGKEFLRGQLIHLALTRVPVNERTKMEVDRSMTTRKEDAESIIGEELAEELEEESVIVGKSEALVIKADEEVGSDTDGTNNVTFNISGDENPILNVHIVEEGKHGKMEDKEDEEDDEEEKKKKEKEKESKADIVEEASVIELLNEIKSQIKVEPSPAHPLDIAVSELKAVYDEALTLQDPQEALRMVQEPFEALAAVIQAGFAKEETEEEKSESVDSQLAEVLNGLREEVGLLRSELATMKAQAQPVGQQQVPVRRSLDPALLQKPQQEKPKSETPVLRSIIEKSVGL